MESKHPIFDFIIGGIAGIFAPFVFRWFGLIISIFIGEAKNKDNSLFERLFAGVFGLLKYVVVPVIIIINMKDRPTFFIGLAIVAIPMWKWLDSDKNA